MLRCLCFLTLLSFTGPLMSSLAGQCRVVVTAANPNAEDVRLASDACARVDERFNLLFGVQPPAGLVEISDTVLFFAIERYGPEWRLVWPTSENIRRYFTGADSPDEIATQLDLHWSTVLPHELGHLLLVAESLRRRGQSAQLDLPDWLNEGTAVWMGTSAHRRDQYAILSAMRPFIPELANLTAISLSNAVDDPEGGSTIVQTFFPCASEQACAGRPHWSRIFSVTTRQFPDGTVRVDTTFHATPPPPPDPLASNFYAYSATLVRFLFDSGGAPAMNALLDRLANERGSAQAPFAGLPGLPGTARELEREWRIWFTRWVFFAPR